MAQVNDQQCTAALQEIPIKSLTRNENPLKKLDKIDKPLTIKQDQQEKQVINTIREVPPEMYVGVSRGYTDYHQGRAIHMADSRID